MSEAPPAPSEPAPPTDAPPAPEAPASSADTQQPEAPDAAPANPAPESSPGEASAPSTPVSEAPIVDIHAADFPKEPDFSPIVGNEGRKAVFGAFEFTPDPVPGNAEHIRILGTWVSDHIISVPIPQLRKALGSHAPESMQFHKLGASQLQALWAAWEDADLLKLILTFDGSFVPRFQRGSTTALSNHAYGSAFDINCNSNPLNSKPLLAGVAGSVRELVPIANKHGFYWGGHFHSRPDGMHFEIGKLI